MISNGPGQAQTNERRAVPARLRSLQNPLDRAFYHPLAARLARALARTPVTPNMVSIAGGLVIVLAGFAYVGLSWPVAVIVGLILHMSWHVLDGADGDLARLTRRASSAGEIVDGICDYLGHFLLYAILAHYASAGIGVWAWIIGTAAGFSRIAQASFYEAQRRQFLGWVSGVAWLRTLFASVEDAPIGKIGKAYLAIVDRLAPSEPQIDAAIADCDRRDAVRTALLDIGPNALSGGTLLGANYRTLALGGSMLAGSPIWYFLYEIVLLNLVFVHGIWRSRCAIAGIRAGL